MRRSGKTTRLVDWAIQELFKDGYVNIISADVDKGLLKGLNYISDYEDVPNRAVLQDIAARIKQRLKLEHHGVTTSFNTRGNTPPMYLVVQEINKGAILTYKILK